MPKTSNKGQLRWLWLTVVLIFLDMLTKKWAVANLTLDIPHYVFQSFNLTLVYNTGSAFGFMANLGGIQRWLLVGIAALVCIVFLIWLKKMPKQQNLTAIAISLVMAGAIGNLLDRLVFGYVVDFIDLYYKSWHWPAFNVADICVCVGVFLLIIAKLGEKDHGK